MEETYEEALARMMEKARKPIPPDLIPYIEEEARLALTIYPLPVLDHDDRGRARCPECGRYLAHNYYTSDKDGFASLDCTEHGWVGKWRS